MKPTADELDRLIDALLPETLGLEPAPDLRARILARVPHRKAPSFRRTRRPQTAENPWMIAAAAAAVFVGLILAANLLDRPSRTPAPVSRNVAERPSTPDNPAPPRGPDPAPAPQPRPEPRREPETPSVLLTPDRTPAPPKEDPRKPEPPPPPPPQKVERETRVEAVARIDHVEGDVRILTGGVKFAAAAGAELLPHHEVTTVGPKSRAVFRFADGTTVDLGPDTQVRQLADGGGRAKSFFLARGSISAEVKKQPPDRPMTVATPQGEAKVLGTTLRLRSDASASRLEVVEGKVRFSRLSDAKAVEVATGHYAVAGSGVDLVSRPIPAPKAGTADRPVLVKIQVVNADTGLPLLQVDPLEDRMTIALADLPTRNLNIRAVTSPEDVGCVLFVLDGDAKLETRAPYLLMGNTAAGKPLPWTPSAGDHVLTVTAYSGGPAPNRKDGLGNAGAPHTVRFRIR